MITIALDAMGGDFGPSVVVPAALQVLAQVKRVHLILVGLPEILEPCLTQYKARVGARLSIHPATEIVEMGESPVHALRKKKNSSMRVAIDLVKSGQAQACVSAGNTGALMATARFVLKMLPGIDRPAIISALPNIHGKVWVLDLGANVDCQAEHLVQFANMGSVLVSALDNNSKPRVGLLNIGSEAIKGSEVVKAAAQQLLDTSDLNYIGYVEGNDIYMGQVDVVVCDGFVGNVALKVSEGLAKLMMKTLKQKFMSSLYARFTALLAAPVLKSMQTLYDPARYNGAIFLGLKGIVLKSHGNADPRAFSFAIQAAIRAAQYQTHVF